MDLESTSIETITNAIKIRFSECYGAMAMANSLVGNPSPTWDLLHNHSAVDIVDAAISKGIDVENLYVSIPKTQKVKDSFSYITLRPISTKDQYDKLVALEKEFTAKISEKVPEWEKYYGQISKLRRTIWAYEKLQKTAIQ